MTAWMSTRQVRALFEAPGFVDVAFHDTQGDLAQFQTGACIRPAASRQAGLRKLGYTLNA